MVLQQTPRMSVKCPGCSGAMTAMTLGGRLGATVLIDTCTACQAFWFDTHENLQLSPGATLQLFKLIGEHSAAGKSRLGDILRCPRCASRLALTHDMQRNTRFKYWRCDKGHGRFITFFDFLKEKDFIKPLSPEQLQELRQSVQTVNCSNCGAPVELASGSVCTHCGSPLSMLDMKQAGQLVSQLQHASEPRPIDPALPLELARIRREVEASFGSLESGTDWLKEVPALGLVEAGLSAVTRWLKKYS
jgi:DNA-directed RNA polymerase subunit RPC12/RpoP